MNAREAVNVLEVWAVDLGIDLHIADTAAPEVEPIPEGRTQADLIRAQWGITDEVLKEVNLNG